MINTIFSSNEYFHPKTSTAIWRTFFTPHQNKTPEWLYENATKLVQNGICSQSGLEQLALGSHKIFKTNDQLASKTAQMFIDNGANIFAVIEFKSKKRSLLTTFLDEQCRMQRANNAIIAAIKTVLEKQQKIELKVQKDVNERNKSETSSCRIQ